MASCFQMEIHTSTKETLLFHKDIFDCWDQERARCMLGITPSRLSLSLGSACQQRRWFLVCSHSHYTGLSSLDLWLSKSDDNWVNSKLIWNELRCCVSKLHQQWYFYHHMIFIFTFHLFTNIEQETKFHLQPSLKHHQHTFKVHIPLWAPKWLLSLFLDPFRIDNSLPLELKSISFLISLWNHAKRIYNLFVITILSKITCRINKYHAIYSFN